jgi:hypothetical protein
MTTLTINKYESNYTLPLYTDYAGQESTAYLCLDMRDGEVSFEERAPHNNGYSQDEFNGYVRTFKIPNNLTVSGLNELLQDRQVIDALRAILSSGEEFYNGNNYRMRLSDDGNEAEAFLDSYEFGGRYDSLEVMSAEWYLNSCSYASLVQHGDTHEEVAVDLAAEALKNGMFVSASDIENTLDNMKEA